MNIQLYHHIRITLSIPLYYNDRTQKKELDCCLIVMSRGILKRRKESLKWVQGKNNKFKSSIIIIVDTVNVSICADNFYNSVTKYCPFLVNGGKTGLIVCMTSIYRVRTYFIIQQKSIEHCNNMVGHFDSAHVKLDT